MGSIFEHGFFKNKPALKSLEHNQEPKPEAIRACLLELSRDLVNRLDSERSLIEQDNREVLECIVNAVKDGRPWQDKAKEIVTAFEQAGELTSLQEFVSWFLDV